MREEVAEDAGVVEMLWWESLDAIFYPLGGEVVRRGKRIVGSLTSVLRLVLRL